MPRRVFHHPFCATFRRPRALGFAAAALLAACSADGFTGPVDVDGVSAAARRGEVVLVNHTATPVFTFVIGRREGEVADLIFCADAALCPPLQPGATRSVPRPRSSDRPEREATVYWWRAEVGPNGVPRPTDFHSAVLPLP